MAININFRKKAVSTLTSQIGVYVLCDLDNIPIYVGQSSGKKEGIRNRVSRHLTSARSDVIANRQIDVWEIAFVWAYPVSNAFEIKPLEAALFHHFNKLSVLMNGTIPSASSIQIPKPAQVVQVMHETEIADKKALDQRLARQAAHYAQIVGHFLAVKNSTQVGRAMDAHFKRLARYHSIMLGLEVEEEDKSADDA